LAKLRTRFVRSRDGSRPVPSSNSSSRS
jgi:hypothetical protein